MCYFRYNFNDLLKNKEKSEHFFENGLLLRTKMHNCVLMQQTSYLLLFPIAIIEFYNILTLCIQRNIYQQIRLWKKILLKEDVEKNHPT